MHAGIHRYQVVLDLDALASLSFLQPVVALYYTVLYYSISVIHLREAELIDVTCSS